MRILVDTMLLPFVLIFKLVGFIFKMTGKAIGMLMGLLLIGLGLFFCLTVIGIFAGIPLIVLGTMILFGGVVG